MTNATQKPSGKSVSFGPESCLGYSGCAAPLCVLDKNLAQACWYPGEPVCRLRQVPKWVKTQRRIAKVLGIPKDADKGHEHYGAFTVKMLECAKRITSKIRGIDLETETEQAWLNKRPSFGVKGEITDITKTFDTPGLCSASSTSGEALTEGQAVVRLVKRRLVRSLCSPELWLPRQVGVQNGRRQDG